MENKPILQSRTKCNVINFYIAYRNLFWKFLYIQLIDQAILLYRTQKMMMMLLMVTIQHIHLIYCKLLFLWKYIYMKKRKTAPELLQLTYKYIIWGRRRRKRRRCGANTNHKAKIYAKHGSKYRHNWIVKRRNGNKTNKWIFDFVKH